MTRGEPDDIGEQNAPAASAPLPLPDEKWVNVFPARNAEEAHVIVEALEAEGITARADFENVATLGAWAGNGPGTTTAVHVLVDDAPKAREIIDERERKNRERRETLKLTCPRCKTLGPKRILSRSRLIGLVLLAVGVVTAPWLGDFCVPIGIPGAFLVLWPTPPRWRCENCGFTWSEPEPDDLDDDASGDDTTTPATPVADDDAKRE